MQDLDLEDDDNVELIKYHEAARDLTYDPKQCCCCPIIPVLGLRELRKGVTYRAALLELIGTALLTFFSCLTVIGVSQSGTAYPALYVSLVHLFIFTFIISSTIPPSGGHVNPLVTLACIFTRSMSVAKGAIYIIAQCLGSTLAALSVRLIVTEPIAKATQIGACGVGEIGVGASFALEVVLDFFFVFIAFGMVLDPHQGEVIGPVVGPFAVSLLLSFTIFISGIILPGSYGGVGLNPARCFGPAVAMFDMDHQWLWWIGAIVAAIFNGILYILVPPHHATLYGKMLEKQRKTLMME